MAGKGQSLPKFGEWDVNNPASAEGFSVVFNKARNDKKGGNKSESAAKNETQNKNGAALRKRQSESIIGKCPARCRLQKTGAIFRTQKPQRVLLEAVSRREAN